MNLNRKLYVIQNIHIYDDLDVGSLDHSVLMHMMKLSIQINVVKSHKPYLKYVETSCTRQHDLR